MPRSVEYVAEGSVNGGGSFPAGTATTYAELPLAFTLYLGEVWYVETPKYFSTHPRGFYIATNSGWEKTTLKVEVSTDAGSLINWSDWNAYLSQSNGVSLSDMVIYDGAQYQNLTGVETTQAPNIDTTNWGSYVDLASRPLTPYKAGRIWYDGDCGCHAVDTGYLDVRNNIGRETHREVYNATALQISNGDPVSVVSGLVTNNLPHIVPTDSSDVLNVKAFVGVATMNIPAGQTGIITSYGDVNGVNTQSLILGFIYLDDNGFYTQIRPVYPLRRLIAGGVLKPGVTDGIINVNPVDFPRASINKSFGFTSQGIGSGLYYKGGFYEWETTSTTLTQANLTQTYGTVGRTYAAHAGIVPGGAGVVVGGGQVGLRVTGIKDSSTGVQQAGQTGIVTEDITTLTLDVMAETSEKFSGQITYELYVVAGTPTSYSLDFNYGYSKYEDLGNQQFTVTGLECVWQGNALDTNFDIALKHHKPEGWVYALTGFLPGNGDIARKTVDQALAGNVVNNLDGAWKRVELNTFINGSELGGLLFEIITGTNNTIQTMDLHISAVSEEL